MKARGLVAIYKLNDSIEEVSVKSDSQFFDNKMESARYLEEHGYKLVRCIITTDERVYHKARLEACLLELRSVVDYHNRYIAEHMGFLPDDVIVETQRLQRAFEETLMQRVAHRVARCLNRDIEVTDELALNCFNFAQGI